MNENPTRCPVCDGHLRCPACLGDLATCGMATTAPNGAPWAPCTDRFCPRDGCPWTEHVPGCRCGARTVGA